METAYSSGVKEMVLAGLGMAWLPMSMIARELQDGRLTDHRARFGKCDLSIACYTRTGDPNADEIEATWSRQTLPHD